MASRPITLLFACDDGVFEGLVLSALSALIHIPLHRPVDLHLIDAGVTDAHFAHFEGLVARVHKGTSIRRHRADLSRFTGLKALNGSLATYARILAPELIDAKQLVYLDCDIYVGRDVGELSDTPGVDLLAGVMDHNIPGLDAASLPLSERRFFRDLGCHANSAYLNAGVLVMNLARLREAGFTRWCLDVGRRYAELLHYYDQTLINAFAAREGATRLPQHWNVPQYWWDSPQCPHDHRCIVHFMGYRNGKPWRVWRRASSYAMAREFYSHLGFQLDTERMHGRWRQTRSVRVPLALVYLVLKYYLAGRLQSPSSGNVRAALTETMEELFVIGQDRNERPEQVAAARDHWRELE